MPLPTDDEPAAPTGEPGTRSDLPTDDAAARVTMYEDGPLLLRGSFQLFNQDGTPIEAGRPTVALCRCGRSAIKPFCDGTHKASGFRAPGQRHPAAQG